MDFEAALTKLEGLLIEERDALVKLDAARLDRITDEKVALIDALRAAPAPRPELAARCVALRDSMRKNLALLAAGRACIRDAIGVLAHGPARPGLCVHVTG